LNTAVLVASVAATILTACKGPAAPPPPPPAPPVVVAPEPSEPTAPPLSGFVLVERDAYFHVRPSAAAMNVALSLTPRTTGAPRVSRSVPFRFAVVAEHGDWIEVTNPPAEPRECVDPPGALADFELTLFVRQGDLVPVVTRPVTHRLKGGEEVTVLAGRWLDRGERSLTLRDGRGVVPLTDEDIGESYAGAPLRAEDPSWTYYVAEDAIFAEGVTPESGGGRIERVLTMTPVDAPGEPPRARATLRSACVESTREVARRDAPPAGIQPAFALGTLDVGADESGAFDLGGALGGGLGGLDADVDAAEQALPEIPADARLFWPDGAPAGRTVRATTPDHATPEHAGRRCFSWTVAETLGSLPPGALMKRRPIVLCVDAATLGD